MLCGFLKGDRDVLVVNVEDVKNGWEGQDECHV